MSRFGTESLQNIDIVVDGTIPHNTKRSKSSVWGQFLVFCEERKYKLNASTTIMKLADILKDWGFNMKRKNGQDYKEGVIKIMWNSTAKQLQEMYFKNFNIKFNPFLDVEFSGARAARDAKRRNLQADPTKRKLSSAALSNRELSKMAQTWDENTPTGLQRKFFLIAGYELAWRGGEASTCCVQHFIEETDNEGVSTGRIEYNPIFSKTTQGGSKKLADSKWLTVNTDTPDICPVRLLRKLLEKRNKYITCNKLFLAPNPNWQNINAKGWYKNMTIGRNKISTWMSESARKIGIDTEKVKITNHSVRASAVSNLAKQGVGEEQLIKVTGHSNAHSIRPYLQMDANHHKQIIETMRNKNGSSNVVCSSTASTSTDSNKGNVTYNNCVFNYN